jgi:hypothetical protein
MVKELIFKKTPHKTSETYRSHEPKTANAKTKMGEIS